MADRSTRKAIHEVLNSKVEAGKPFTAYEIEGELRAGGYYVSRSDVKEVLAQRFKRNYLGNFLRSRAEVPGNPWVYHELETNLDAYGLTSPMLQK